jgi:peroxiredoxin Q/BCP
MKVGEKIPALSVEATSDLTLQLNKLDSNYTVIYFYPKDSTPGCTTEGQNFRDEIESFNNLGVTIFGVSRESLKSHERFKQKQEFPFELISDPDEIMCKAFDVIKLKKLYGKEYLGIERSTFLFDKKGKLIEDWRKVRVKGHVDQVLQFIKDLKVS